MAKQVRPTTIAAYIRTFPTELHPRMFELHELILQSAPGVNDSLKWGMPAYSYDKILVMFGCFKNHIGFFPGPTAIPAFKKELEKFTYSAATIQFPHNKALPKALIRKLVKFRVKEFIEGVLTWR